MYLEVHSLLLKVSNAFFIDSTALQKLLQPTETAKFAANVLEGPRGELEGAPPQPKGARRSLGIISNTASGIEEAA